MKSLESLCVNAIILNELNYNDLPLTLVQNIDKEKIIKDCGNVVTTRIAEANNEINDTPTGPHEWGWGWLSGLNQVCQQKEYKYKSAKSFEACLKRNIHNVCGPPCALVIYYSSQDPEFGAWYNETTAKKLFWNNRRGEYKYEPNILVLHQTWEEFNWIK